MTNDEIDIIIRNATTGSPPVIPWQIEQCRLAFRAGMEAAARICEDLTKPQPSGRDYITLDAIDYADAIRAAANDQ